VVDVSHDGEIADMRKRCHGEGYGAALRAWQCVF
jgi:hypothetical protein